MAVPIIGIRWLLSTGAMPTRSRIEFCQSVLRATAKTQQVSAASDTSTAEIRAARPASGGRPSAAQRSCTARPVRYPMAVTTPPSTP